MMYETEDALHEGTVLTGRYYKQEGRNSYQQEKQSRGDMPEEPLAGAYFDDDKEWERSYEFIDRHK